MKSLRRVQQVLTKMWLLLIFLLPPLSANSADLPPRAAEIFRLAQQGRWFANADKLNPEVLPTSDGQSFLVMWKPPGTAPTRWIVSLHGSEGFAMDDLAIWHPHIKDREIGLLCLQWWSGRGDDTRAYLMPHQIYREIDITLERLGVRPGNVMLHGFSRGSANSYAVAALDAGRGRNFFSLRVASSGGVGLDYPPNLEILSGRFGDRPLRQTRWITVAGGRDQNPERDGIPGMRRAAEWLREQGAEVIETIEDAGSGHGALMTNPANARRVLDQFEKITQTFQNVPPRR